MIDPMANLDGGAPGASDATDEKDVIDVTSLRYNLERVDKVRSVMGIASGCVAGICGLTGLEGLGTFYHSKQGRCWRYFTFADYFRFASSLFFSLFCRITLPRPNCDVGSENEFPTLGPHKTKLVVVCFC
jgi:hypothetical protein